MGKFPTINREAVCLVGCIVILAAASSCATASHSIVATLDGRPESDSPAPIHSNSRISLATNPAEDPAATLREQYQQALDAVMSDMADPQKSFDFVKVAIALGDLRGAIAALERVLRINPNLANIKLELGILYLRIASPDLAQTYITQALESEDVPELVRLRAERFLERAEAQVAGLKFSGSIFTAGRYETNATAAPSSSRVRLVNPFTGVEDLATLQEEDTEQEDYSAVFGAQGRVVYALDSQMGNEIEANAMYFGSRYLEQTRLNLNIVDINIGPRFFFGEVLNPNLSVRPYAIGTYIAKDGQTFQRDFGLGVNGRYFFSPRLFGEVRSECRNRDFFETDQSPFNDERDGYLVTAQSTVGWEVRPGTIVLLRLRGVRNDADEDFESYWEAGVTLSLRQFYPAPFGLTDQPWNSSLTGAIRRTEFDDNDPFLSLTEVQEDDRTEFTFLTNVPVVDNVDLTLTVQRTENSSNLDIQEFENWLFSVGMQLEF